MPADRALEPVFVENEHIRVGIDLQWGGAITHVSLADGVNLINSHDLGRQIQQSYYSGPPNYQREGKRKSPHWAGFPWNPIQTGDAFYNGSQVLTHQLQEGEQLYVKTIPMLWPMDNDPGECVMETWITLSPDMPKFTYHARLTNERSDTTQYDAAPQEVPAVYVNGPWHQLMTYTGDAPFTSGEVSEMRNDHSEPWPWINFIATEGWAALMNDDGFGIGVCVPHAMEFHGGFHGQRGQGDAASSNTGYMSPITREILDHNIVYEYRVVFLLGDIDTIREEAANVSSGPLPSWRFTDARQGWYYQNGKDDGWPIAGRGLKPTAQNKEEPVRVISPITFWRADDTPKLSILISSDTESELRVFWRGMPSDDASTRPSIWHAWQSAWWDADRSVSTPLSAGDQQWVTVDLSASAAYTGGMTGLAIEIMDGFTLHEVRLINE